MKAPLKHERSYGAVVIDPDDGMVLLEVMVQGHVSIPKGHVEAGETGEQTALREILEETGLTVKLDTDFEESSEYSPSKNVMKLVTFFLAFPTTRVLLPQKEEVKKLMWVTPEEAENLLTFQSDKNIVKDACAYFREHYPAKK